MQDWPHGHRWPRPPGNPFIEPRPRQRGSDAAAGCGGAMFIAELLLPWGCWLIPQPRSPVVRSDGCPMPCPVDADPGRSRLEPPWDWVNSRPVLGLEEDAGSWQCGLPPTPAPSTCLPTAWSWDPREASVSLSWLGWGWQPTCFWFEL